MPKPASTSAERRRLWLRAVAVWLALIGAEIVHGTLRTLWLVPAVGDFRARQIGVFVGSALILVIAYLTAPWLRARTTRSQWLVGLLWLVLTVLFEVGLGRLVLGYTWERIASDYNLLQGGLMPLGLLVLTAAPMVPAKLRAGRHWP